MNRNVIAGGLGALMWAWGLSSAGASGRSIPQPLPGHPGNIFLAGESVTVPTAAREGGVWRAVDYEGKVVAEGRIKSGKAELGRLPIGYYEVHEAEEAAPPMAVGVLARLRAPTPLSSPIGTDVALAWLVPREQMRGTANLCALAGVNWVRDRLDWAELEPSRGGFGGSNRYDRAIAIQSAAGLRVLQVSHRSPAWANPNTKRFPLDLRDAYEYHRQLARRWRGQVAAFEPWNEADIPAFGGHTGSEMASFQKASFLGLKAGNPKVIACLNVFALHPAAALGDLNENEAWPYFDTFNLHHYEPFAAYPKLYADFRAVSAGRPLWVTECSLPVKWSGEERWQEPSRDDLRVQSERMAMTFAQALHEGAQAVFYFILPHFVEGQTQFGVLRRDLSPRPAYLALAAVGRFLADAEPLGRVQSPTDGVHGFLFDAKPDGRSAKVLVIWSDSHQAFQLSKPPGACFDHLGRPQAVAGKGLRVGPAPLFVVLAQGTTLSLVSPARSPVRLPGRPCQVVLQALMPEESLLLDKSAYKIPAGQSTTLPLFVYNFGDKKARGRLRVEPPSGWEVECPHDLEVAAGQREAVPVRLNPAGGNRPGEAQLKFTGDFRVAGQAVLSLRLMFQ